MGEYKVSYIVILQERVTKKIIELKLSANVFTYKDNILTLLLETERKRFENRDVRLLTIKNIKVRSVRSILDQKL